MVLGTKIHGLVVGGVLVEESLRIQHEFYIGITIDRSSRKPVALASSMGGMDIEEVAKSSPEKIVRRYIDPLLGMCEFEARMIARKAGFADAELGDASKVMLKLWRIMREYDAELVESNPFVRTEDGR